MKTDIRRRTGVTSRLRLRGHNYAQPGTYFVTLCTSHRACLFGDIRDGQVILSLAGQVVESWWDSLAVRFTNVTLDERVVMPNHLHGITMIEDECPTSDLRSMMKWFKGNSTNDYMIGVRAYRWPRFEGKLWQPGYYDHIVRTNAKLDRIREYIRANPSRWPWDQENPDRITDRPRAQGPGLPEDISANS